MSHASNKKYTHKINKIQYFHLKEQERFRIQNIMEDQIREKGKVNISEIARMLGRNKSTISRELKRNKTIQVNKKSAIKDIFKLKKEIKIVYDFKEADIKAKRRQQYKSYRGRKLIKNVKLREFVNEKLSKQGKSPDIIAYMVKNTSELGTTIATSTIYDGIRVGLFDVKAKDRKRMKINSRRCRISRNPVPKSKKERSIELRPSIINDRKEFGHYEMDIVVGTRKGSKNCLLTLTERKTRFEIILKIQDRSPLTVQRVFEKIKKYTKNYSNEIFKSITTDNGIEFSNYEEIEKIIGTKIYFCHPGASYEKGTNERHNGMIREYIPKGKDISNYSNKFINDISEQMNDLERRILNYKTPYQMVLSEYDSVEGTELLFTLQNVINNV